MTNKNKMIWIIGIVALLIFINQNTNKTQQTILQFADNCISSGGHTNMGGDYAVDILMCSCRPMENVEVAYDKTKIFMGCGFTYNG